jgi:hypothetical protein
MKIILVLLLSLSLSCLAQKGEAWKVIGVYTGSIVFNAMGDGFNNSGHKQLGHAFNATSIGLLLASPFVIDYDKSKWGYYLTSYVALRMATFDYVYNTTRGLPLNYIGGTSTWDKFLGKMNPPNTYMGRGVFFIVGVSIPLNKIGGK